MNIYYLSDKIKLSAIIVLSILLILGLGLRIRLLGSKQPIRIDNVPVSMPNNMAVAKPSVKVFMASRNGSKYYPTGCKAGDRIKPENRIFFSDKEEAEAAGYTRTVSCN